MKTARSNLRRCGAAIDFSVATGTLAEKVDVTKYLQAF